jgi:hypothetical protein
MGYESPTTEQMQSAQTVEERFMLMDRARSGKLEYLREMAKYINAGLLPDYEYEAEDELLTERYSNTATMLAEQLTAMIVASVYPLNNVPWFNWLIPYRDDVANEVIEQAREIARDTEFDITSRLEASTYRQALHTAVLQAMVLADAVIYQGDDYKFRVYPVDDFVIRRDAANQISDMIIRDWLDTENLPQNLASINKGNEKSDIAMQRGRSEPHYTRLSWDPDKKNWKVTKEFRKTAYETGTTFEVSPYMHLSWSRVHNEDYGRSLVEMNWGTIRSLELLHKARTEMAAAMSRVHPAVNPEGSTEVEAIDNDELRNFDVISAREQDIWWLTAPLNPQFAGLTAAIEDTEARLSKVFLADTARSLRGERVTAFQVQEAVSEQEQSLGNVLGSIAKQIQRQVVARTLAIEVKEGRFSRERVQLLEEVGQLEIKSGLDALGRQLEGARLQALMSIIPTLPPEATQSINFESVLDKLMASAGLDPRELQFTEEQQQARALAAQQQQLQQQAGQQAIETTGNVIEAQARQQG